MRALSKLPDFAPAVIELPARGEDSVPAEARKVALARLDLLLAWNRFRAGYARKSEGDAAFEVGYNSGVVYPHLFKVLGKVSVKTLYKWVQALDENGASLKKPDWKYLVPAYHYRGTGQAPGLTPAERDRFLQFLLHDNKIKISNAIDFTRRSLAAEGIESTASEATFRRYSEWFKKSHYDTWTFMREGKKALIDKVAPYIRRDASLLEPGQILVADGHRLNFQILNPFTGKPCRAMLVGYLDWKSFDLLGYEIMLEENTQCIASALRNAILNLGKVPQFCYQDNGKAFKSKFFTDSPSLEEVGFQGLFSRIGITPVFSMPYNARAKVIELFWKTFTNSFERLVPSFIGSSIEDKPAGLGRNETWHREKRSGYVPTLTDAIQMIDTWLEHRRNTEECPYVKGQSIAQVIRSGRGPGVAPEILDELMMAEKIARPDRNGVRFMGEHYGAEEIYGYQHSVVIRYSLFDLSYIKVYEPNGKFICVATKREPFHPVAFHLASVAEQEKLKGQIAENQRLLRGTVRDASMLRVDGGESQVLEAAGIELPAVPTPLPSPPFDRLRAGQASPARGEGVPAAQARNWGKRAVEAEDAAREAERAVDLSIMLPPEVPKKKELVLFESDLTEGDSY